MVLILENTGVVVTPTYANWEMQTICFRRYTRLKPVTVTKTLKISSDGDMVMTNAGAQPLAKLSKGLPTSMIKIPKDLLAKNVPNSDVVV